MRFTSVATCSQVECKYHARNVDHTVPNLVGYCTKEDRPVFITDILDQLTHVPKFPEFCNLPTSENLG